MARYIDADELIKKIYPMGMGDGMYVINAKAVKFAIDNTPTAEIVPKSEVDRLNAVMKEMDEQRAYTINMLGENLENAKAEVERLKKDNEYILMQHRFQRRPDGKCWNDVIEKAKTEVAREIFAEIESMLIRYTFDDDYISLGIIDEFSDFKKKFTGEKT